jgi:hypothetical protein
MGKSTLITITLITVVLAAVLYQVLSTSFESRKAEAERGEVVLARELARSGLNATISQVKRDFDAWRSGFTGAVLQGGTFDAQVEGTAAGPVDVTIDAFLSGASYRIRSQLVRLGAWPSAVVVDADSASVSFDGSDFLITGRDTRPPSASVPLNEGSGHDQHVNALLTRTNAAWTAFSSALSNGVAENVRGVAAERDIVNTTLPVDLDALYAEAVAVADQVYTGSQVFSGSTTLGSPAAPTIVVVEGDATLTDDVQGYGMLVVEGALTLSGNALWEGIIMAASDGALGVTYAGQARHYGTLLLRHVASLPDEIIDFEIIDDEIVPQECFEAGVTILGSAISAGGAYDLMVTTQFSIGEDAFEPWGDFDQAVTGNVNDEANPRTYMATEVYPAGTAIVVLGQSWDKNDPDDSGTSNSDWESYMDLSSSSGDSPQLKVLRDGDPVPQIDGFLDQQNIEQYVGAYVQDGYIALEPNQAIYLFELGTTDLDSDAADFQDLVALVTLSAASGAGCTAVASSSGGPGTLDVRVASGSDDAEEASDGDMSLTSSDLELVTDGSTVQTVGVRFRNVGIPKGATITSAYLQYTVDETSSGTTRLTLRGHDVDNSSAFSSADHDLSSRATTAASVAWDPSSWSTVGSTGVAQQTPDLAAIVQEIIDREGWASNNPLTFILTGTGSRVAESYEGSAATAPLLHVEWTMPTSVTEETLTFSLADEAALYYSTEAIGKLAARLDLIREASWVVEQDRWVGKPEHDEAGEVPSIANVCHATNGVSKTLSVSVNGVEAHLAHGDTEGACVYETNGNGGGNGGGNIP